MSFPVRPGKSPLPNQSRAPSPWRALLLSLAAIFGSGLRAEIKGYTQPETLSDPTLINLGPAIGETGLIAWYAHSREVYYEDGGGSKIFVYHQGKREEVSKSHLWEQAANTKPVVSG